MKIPMLTFAVVVMFSAHAFADAQSTDTPIISSAEPVLTPQEKPTADAPSQKNTVKIEKLTGDQFYEINAALLPAVGISMDSDRNLLFDDDKWQVSDVADRARSHDRKMGIDLKGTFTTSKDIIAMNLREDRATLTTFENMKAVSHTIVSESGRYTATPRLCSALKAQTNSTDFHDMATKAKACNLFYLRNDGVQSSFADVIKTHQKNIVKMNNSVAKPIMEKFKQSPETFGDKQTSVIDRAMGIIGRLDGTREKPRAVLSKAPTKEELLDRQVMADLAEACQQFWGNSATTEMPASTTGKSAPVSK